MRNDYMTPGTAVRVKTLTYSHTGVVLHNAGFIGGDGRHWVQVNVVTEFTNKPWAAHFEIHELELAE